MFEQSKPPALQFRFLGTGTGFFKIWFVNVALIILTLGIYLPWAKVRAQRYLYQNTELWGSRFEYHGNPKALLRGYLLVFVLGILYALLSQTAPILSLVLILLVACGLPYLMVRSLQFNMVNSSFKGIRFGFVGTVKGMCWAMMLPSLVVLAGLLLWVVVRWVLASSVPDVVWVLLLVVGVLAAMGWMLLRQRLYVLNHLCFGRSNCSVALSRADTLMLGVKSVTMLAVFVAVLGFVGWYLFFLFSAAIPADGSGALPPPVAMLPMFLVPLFYIFSIVWTSFSMAELTRVVWNHTQLAQVHTFHSTLNPWKMVWIQLSNTVLLTLTFGLYRPFAVVRVLRYRLENTHLTVQGSAEQFLASEQAQVSATGESMVDALGFDVQL